MVRRISLTVGAPVVSGSTLLLSRTDNAGLTDSVVLNMQTPSSSKWGMDFEPSAGVNAPYESQSEVARIYVADNQTDIHNEGEYVRAKALGIDTYVLSWKVGTPTSVGETIDSCVSDGNTVYGCAHHEPEDLTASAFQTLQASHMPAVRAHGGIPTAIFTSISFHNANNPFDLGPWILPAGLIDVLGVDYYPDKEPAFTQPQRKAGWVQAMDDFGVDRTLIGEYGTPNGLSVTLAGVSHTGPALVAEAKGLLEGFSEVNCWWSNQVAGKPDYHFSTSVATPWFA